ncbi:hypothetical protein F5B22DRAFT_650989 [Xylaria bambusicola]|uniref:uncharacterized protein n=1 Tax=Xylaria bambusicola TaxID=326684 RepID=UPI0020079668|nr:uncharacterized protein F5B22DRAFT_650989 [Xylaria bambusicola]KAI0506166.1 hypothetical protein F5B22DRAFT_650989 [Xylaria bambusicola]
MFGSLLQDLIETTTGENENRKKDDHQHNEFGSKTWCLTQPPGDVLLEAQRKAHRNYEPVPRGGPTYLTLGYPNGPSPAVLNHTRDIVYRAGFNYPLNWNYEEHVGRSVSDGTRLPNPDRELGKMKWRADIPQPLTFPRPISKFSYPNPSLQWSSSNVPPFPLSSPLWISGHGHVKDLFKGSSAPNKDSNQLADIPAEQPEDQEPEDLSAAQQLDKLFCAMSSLREHLRDDIRCSIKPQIMDDFMERLKTVYAKMVSELELQGDDSSGSTNNSETSTVTLGREKGTLVRPSLLSPSRFYGPAMARKLAATRPMIRREVFYPRCPSSVHHKPHWANKPSYTPILFSVVSLNLEADRATKRFPPQLSLARRHLTRSMPRSRDWIRGATAGPGMRNYTFGYLGEDSEDEESPTPSAVEHETPKDEGNISWKVEDEEESTPSASEDGTPHNDDDNDDDDDDDNAPDDGAAGGGAAKDGAHTDKADEDSKDKKSPSKTSEDDKPSAVAPEDQALEDQALEDQVLEDQAPAEELSLLSLKEIENRINLYIAIHDEVEARLLERERQIKEMERTQGLSRHVNNESKLLREARKTMEETFPDFEDAIDQLHALMTRKVQAVDVEQQWENKPSDDNSPGDTTYLNASAKTSSMDRRGIGKSHLEQKPCLDKALDSLNTILKTIWQDVNDALWDASPNAPPAPASDAPSDASPDVRPSPKRKHNKKVRFNLNGSPAVSKPITKAQLEKRLAADSKTIEKVQPDDKGLAANSETVEEVCFNENILAVNNETAESSQSGEKGLVTDSETTEKPQPDEKGQVADNKILESVHLDEKHSGAESKTAEKPQPDEKGEVADNKIPQSVRLDEKRSCADSETAEEVRSDEKGSVPDNGATEEVHFDEKPLAPDSKAAEQDPASENEVVKTVHLVKERWAADNEWMQQIRLEAAKQSLFLSRGRSVALINVVHFPDQGSKVGPSNRHGPDDDDDDEPQITPMRPEREPKTEKKKPKRSWPKDKEDMRKREIKKNWMRRLRREFRDPDEEAIEDDEDDEETDGLPRDSDMREDQEPQDDGGTEMMKDVAFHDADPREESGESSAMGAAAGIPSRTRPRETPDENISIDEEDEAELPRKVRKVDKGKGIARD